jgi:hypothetical protein
MLGEEQHSLPSDMGINKPGGLQRVWFRDRVKSQYGLSLFEVASAGLCHFKVSQKTKSF